MRTGISTRNLFVLLTVAVFTLRLPEHVRDGKQVPTVSKIVEIRSYNLKLGTRSRFHSLFIHQALPMLKKWKVDIVAFGPSLHDEDSYYLMRGFQDLRQREIGEDAFYGSAEWKDGPREEILSLIVSYTTIVIEADSTLESSLRRWAGSH